MVQRKRTQGCAGEGASAVHWAELGCGAQPPLFVALAWQPCKFHHNFDLCICNTCVSSGKFGIAKIKLASAVINVWPLWNALLRAFYLPINQTTHTDC
jgi:hypothetical protein